MEQNNGDMSRPSTNQSAVITGGTGRLAYNTNNNGVGINDINVPNEYRRIRSQERKGTSQTDEPTKPNQKSTNQTIGPQNAILRKEFPESVTRRSYIGKKHSAILPSKSYACAQYQIYLYRKALKQKDKGHPQESTAD